MNELLKAYKEKWIVPILFAFLCVIIGLLTISIQSKIVLYLSLVVPFLALLASGISGIIRIFRKRYKTGILQLIVTGVIGFLALNFISYYLILYPYDYYADSLEIPENIEINFPKGEVSRFLKPNELKINKEPKNKDFELYTSHQPGLYTYDIWLSNIDSGKIFLKVYEITKNDRLSESRLTESSEIIVGHSHHSLQKHSTKKHFTIYEGDWGKPYSARFEVWFKKNNSNAEKKLLEKSYVIEGWQR